MERNHRVTCKTCGKLAKFDPPHGWYQLTVNVPGDIAARGYVWLGVFCSPKCLALHMPDVRLMNDYTEDLYERA